MPDSTHNNTALVSRLRQQHYDGPNAANAIERLEREVAEAKRLIVTYFDECCCCDTELMADAGTWIAALTPQPKGADHATDR